MIQKALLGLGLFALVAFLPRLIKRLRKKPARMLSAAELKQRLDKGEGKNPHSFSVYPNSLCDRSTELTTEVSAFSAVS